MKNQNQFCTHQLREISKKGSGEGAKEGTNTSTNGDTYNTNEEDGMAKSIAKFRALIDRLAAVGVVLEEGDKTNALLSSLIDSWKSFKSINGNEQSLSLHMLIGKILQKEQRLKEENGGSSKDIAKVLVVRKGKFKKSKAFKGKCFSCGKIGHKSIDCRVKNKKKISGGDSFNY